MKKIKIKASSHEYDITIGHGIRFEINELINDSYSSIMIITDEVIENLYLNDIKDTLNFDNITTYILPSGEAEKSINNYYKIHTRAIEAGLDRKSTRLNSSHVAISYAVFCLKKKTKYKQRKKSIQKDI